jgi:hypothetical protein
MKRHSLKLYAVDVCVLVCEMRERVYRDLVSCVRGTACHLHPTTILAQYKVIPGRQLVIGHQNTNTDK